MRAARVSFDAGGSAAEPHRAAPRRGRPRREAVFDETTSEELRRQSPPQLLSAVSLPAEASTIDSSVARTAKSGGGAA